MPYIMSDAEIKAAIPALRYAVKQSGAPGWVMLALKTISKWFPTILRLFVELAPLFATGRYVRPDRIVDPLDDPELSIATKATIRHARDMQRTGFDMPFDE